MATTPEPPRPPEGLSFADAAGLAAWLAAHHATHDELWVRIYRADAGVATVNWTDCMIEALRVGWIDGAKRPLDAVSWLQRLSPRRPNSPWSLRNRAHALRLIEMGRMTPAGLAEVEAARADGRWEAAYAGQATMEIPQDFLDALRSRPRALAFFETLDRRNLYPIYYRLATARRPETRARRLEALLARLERGERFH